jgi:DNA-binding transcriptional MerR regulator
MPEATPPEGELLTIDQLAARTGLTVRNIRSHVTRGLLPPPLLKGRTGFYGLQHVARLQLVTSLQEQGFNLAAITKLVSGLAAPWLTEPAEIWNEAELAAGFGLMPDPELVQRLRKLGVLDRMPDGLIEVRNPAIIRVGRRLAELGYGIEDLMTVLRVLMQQSRVVAEAFVQMFLDVQWKDYVEAGMPAERLPGLQSLIEQLQPLASQAVIAAFQQAMTDATARAFEREATIHT